MKFDWARLNERQQTLNFGLKTVSWSEKCTNVTNSHCLKTCFEPRWSLKNDLKWIVFEERTLWTSEIRNLGKWGHGAIHSPPICFTNPGFSLILFSNSPNRPATDIARSSWTSRKSATRAILPAQSRHILENVTTASRQSCRDSVLLNIRSKHISSFLVQNSNLNWQREI